MLDLVRSKKYFVLHAPRQIGKTSALLALRDLLNGGDAGNYRCVYANVEVGQAAREDTARAMRAMLGQLASRAETTLGDRTPSRLRHAALADAGPDGALFEVLSRWTQADPRPLVLLIDEIDALIGDTLLSVLRQLRAGYDQRPRHFPHSVVLCGVRDVRDYRVHSTSQNALVLGGSEFNIRSKSVRLGDFTEAETRALLARHTEETGQAFAPEAVELIWNRTAGQPWLVNALGWEACFESKVGRDRSRAIVADDIVDAQERLILARVTHLDNLADKLREERVRRVVAPMLTGAADRDSYADRARDVEYARDLGLLAQDDAKRIANPIYAEVIPRELTWVAEDDVEAETAWYVDAGGGLDVDKLLEAFQRFFREHSEHLDAALRPVPGGRAATAAAGVSSEGRERWRPHRTGVRPGPRARRSAARLAAWRPRPAAAASNGSTPWAEGASICCSSGRMAAATGGSWSSARCAATGWSGRYARASSRLGATWTVAGRSRGTWWSSTARRPGRGRRRSSAAESRPAALRRSTSGGCDGLERRTARRPSLRRPSTSSMMEGTVFSLGSLSRPS